MLYKLFNTGFAHRTTDLSMKSTANIAQDIPLYFDWKNKVDRDAFLGRMAQVVFLCRNKYQVI